MHKISNPTAHIRDMIATFQTPPSDAIANCVLAYKQPVGQWNAGLYISRDAETQIYSDIFHFWVRAFYNFVEDLILGKLFKESAKWIRCTEMPVSEFEREYCELLNNSVSTDAFHEWQQFPQTRMEFEKRTFSKAYTITNHKALSSSVAASQGDFVAYFVTDNRSS